MAIADDSGLVVDALDGEPGVYSARYAGVHGDDAANNAKLLVNLEGVADEDRTARFMSVVALIDTDGLVTYGEGACEGVIAHEAAAITALATTRCSCRSTRRARPWPS